MRSRVARLLSAAALLATIAATACAPGVSGSGGSAAADNVVRPLACAAARSRGVFPSPPAGTQVTIPQIASAVGFPVSDAQVDASSASAFKGYESCEYGFTTPTLGQSVTVYLVVGTNPLDDRTANDEFTQTESSQTPLSNRSCRGNGCSYHFAAVAGIGDAALKGTNAGTEVIAARRGRVYLEVGPGTLSEARMENLAGLILSQVQ